MSSRCFFPGERRHHRGLRTRECLHEAKQVDGARCACEGGECGHGGHRSMGENHPDTAGSYNNLGVAYNNKGEHDRAIESYERGH